MLLLLGLGIFFIFYCICFWVLSGDKTSCNKLWAQFNNFDVLMHMWIIDSLSHWHKNAASLRIAKRRHFKIPESVGHSLWQTFLAVIYDWGWLLSQQRVLIASTWRNNIITPCYWHHLFSSPEHWRWRTGSFILYMEDGQEVRIGTSILQDQENVKSLNAFVYWYSIFNVTCQVPRW